MISRLLALLTVLLLVPGIEAQVPVKPRLDSLGDPMPDGAIARIGTLRYKHNPALNGTLIGALFAPDGSKIVSFDSSNVRLWDAGNGKEIPGPWSTSNKPPNAVAFSPDSATLAVNVGIYGNGQAYLGEIILYDIASGQSVKVISGVRHSARALAFADGGKTLISAGEGTVCWWDVGSGKEKRTWKPFPEEKKANEVGETKTFINCALSPDGKSLAVEVAWCIPEAALNGGRNRNETTQEAVGFNLDSGKMTWKATGVRSRFQQYNRVPSGVVMTGQTSCLAFSADGKRVALPVIQDNVEVHDTVTGKLVIPHLETKVSAGEVLGLTLSSDGSQVALASTDGQVTLWNGKNEAGPRKFMTRIAQPRSVKRCLHFSPDDKKLLVGTGADIQVYDVASLQEVQPWEGHRGWIDYVQFASDGNKLYTGSAKNNQYAQELASWDTSTWKRLQLTSLSAPPWPNVGSVSADQSVYADKGGAELFDLKSGKLLARLNALKGAQQRGFFSPSAKHYLLGGEVNNGKSVERLYGVPSGKLLCELPPIGRNINPTVSAWPVAFTADERLVAIVGQDGIIHVCDTASGQERRRLGTSLTPEGFNGNIYLVANLAFSPDGKHLATWIVNLHEFQVGPQSKPIRVWDVATGKELLQIVPDSRNTARGFRYDRMTHFAWSPDSRVLAVGQNKIRLWEVATFGVRRELPGHGDSSVQTLAFSRDGRLLASGSTDTTVLIWDTSMSGAIAALARGELEKRWQALAKDAPAEAYAAIRALIAAPKETVAWMKEQLKPVEPVDPKRVEELIGQLDNEQFKMRQKANSELLRIGERVAPMLDKALASNLSLETTLRLQALNTRVTSPILKGDRLQAFRAVEVLENINTPEARQVLHMLAGGAPGAMVTTQAQAALTRLRR